MSEQIAGRERHRIMRAGAMAMIVLALQAAPSAGQSRDQAQASLLVGTWEPADARATPIDSDPRVSGFFYTEQFLSDGTGLFNVYSGKVCGRLVAAHAFQWKVSQGNLISRTSYPEEMSADKIVSLNRSDVTFLSQAGGEPVHRHKITECPVS